jgi:hypothetical protein
MTNHSLLPDIHRIARVDVHSQHEQQAGSIMGTEDRELIRQWAVHHKAEPATGEATESGPATVDVHDGGAGIRFNFPAASPFRPISWDEWFQNFTHYDLIFVYAGDMPGENQSGRYRLVPRQQLRAISPDIW